MSKEDENGTGGTSGESAGADGPREDVFGFTDEFGGLRDQWAYAFGDDANDHTRWRGRYRPGQVAIRGIRR